MAGAAPIAQSDKKEKLWLYLGVGSDADHREMLREAAEGRDRLSYNRENLTSLSMADTTVKAPYTWDQLSETAKHREILNILASASPRTRIFYDRARYMTPVSQDQFVEENWAIRWYIWHSFRYRDNRREDNKKGRPGHGNGPNRYYDPARSQWLGPP